MRVSEYIGNAVSCSDKSQNQIAAEAGFPKPNIITMFKQGITRIPLDRVPALASALSVDARELMDLCLTEYRPDLEKTLQDLYGIDFGNRCIPGEIL